MSKCEIKLGKKKDFVNRSRRRKILGSNGWFKVFNKYYFSCNCT